MSKHSLYNILILLSLAAAAVAACSCAASRHVPEGESVLNRVRIETDKAAPREERIQRNELEGYVMQTPARRFLGLNLPVWVYNMANPDKSNGWNNFLRKLGNQPVVHDSLRTAMSASNMEQYVRSRGYFDASASFATEQKRRRNINVGYSVVQGEPYRIGSITHDFRDKFLEQVMAPDSAQTLLRTGDIFDFTRLDNERIRISNILRDRGYYNFSVDNISYLADTLSGDRNIDLTIVVKQHISGFDEKGDPIEVNNAIYRIRNIYVFTDYETARMAGDPEKTHLLDTVSYNGLNIIALGRPTVRPATLRRAITLYPEYIYSYSDVQRVYDNIIRLGYFKSVSILFSEVREPEESYVTIIGDGGETGQHTREKYLDCFVFCTPGLLQSYSVDLEATSSSGFFGLKSSLNYQNRNLFRGSEQFNIGISGGYEFMKASQLRDSYEIGVSSSLHMPRFLTPFPIDRAHKIARPQTRVEFSVNTQNRSKYRRTISSGRWGYSWARGRHKTLLFRPLDVSIVKMGYIDQEFYDSITNPYLQDSYESQMIAGFSGAFVYNNNAYSRRGSLLMLRINWETSGNLLYGLSKGLGLSHNSSGQYTLLGIPYSQYVRADMSLSNNIPIAVSRDMCFVYRLYSGLAFSYGNSTAVPNTRLFSSGGANSMRGWAVRTLGQGNMPEISDSDYPAQMGNVKLELNAEIRFPMWKALRGALFFDMGNIWLLGNMASVSDEAGVFYFDKFYRQLGLNTGFGLRLDLNIAILRLDWGVQLHNPNRPAGDRWIKKFRYSDTAFSFGIGYPF